VTISVSGRALLHVDR